MSKQLNQLQLSHVDSLLRYLLMLRAKQMIINCQCPFTQVLSKFLSIFILIQCFQIIPADYKEDLTENLMKEVKEVMLGVSHQDILSTLFVFIWTQLRSPATGDDSERPNQKLKVFFLCMHLQLIQCLISRTISLHSLMMKMMLSPCCQTLCLSSTPLLFSTLW